MWELLEFCKVQFFLLGASTEVPDTAYFWNTQRCGNGRICAASEADSTRGARRSMFMQESSTRFLGSMASKSQRRIKTYKDARIFFKPFIDILSKSKTWGTGGLHRDFYTHAETNIVLTAVFGQNMTECNCNILQY